MSDMRPRVLAILPALIPSTIISVVKPFIELCRAGYITMNITLEAFADQRDVAWADLVVFCRNSEPTYARCLDLVMEKGIPYIYDLDDNFFEIPRNSAVGRYHGASERIALLTRYVSGARLVRVYSEELLRKARRFNSNVERVDGPLDLRLVPPRSQYIRSPSDHGRVKIVYATSRRSDDFFDDIYVPALIRVLDEYREVEVHIWGHRPAALRRHEGICYHRVIMDYDRFLRKFWSAKYDIGLAPLHDDPFLSLKKQ